MRVLDIKAEQRKNKTIDFRKLEESLAKCSSLHEQKMVLKEFYKNSTFSRDKLLTREFTLVNKKTFGLKEILFGYKDVLLVLASSLLTLYFDQWFKDGNDLVDHILVIISYFASLGSVVGLFYLLGVIEKEKYVRNDVPLQEIYAFELIFVRKALAKGLIENGKEIDVEVLVKEVEEEIRNS